MNHPGIFIIKPYSDKEEIIQSCPESQERIEFRLHIHLKWSNFPQAEQGQLISFNYQRF